MIISKYTQIIPFFFYAINAKIITEKEIVDWADNELRNETEPPYFIVALSLSHSVNEQFSILNEVLPYSYDLYRKISFYKVINKINKNYIQSKNIIKTIDKIFHLINDDINMEKAIENRIYLLDNSRDLYIEGIISLKDLRLELNTFLQDYSTTDK